MIVYAVVAKDSYADRVTLMSRDSADPLEDSDAYLGDISIHAQDRRGRTYVLIHIRTGKRSIAQVAGHMSRSGRMNWFEHSTSVGDTKARKRAGTRGYVDSIGSIVDAMWYLCDQRLLPLVGPDGRPVGTYRINDFPEMPYKP